MGDKPEDKKREGPAELCVCSSGRIISLSEWVKLHQRIGLLTGALLGLREQVDKETRTRIDNVLRKTESM